MLALPGKTESLNALYAYEAKMCFLTRLAATREGAERMLDAQTLPKLAQCTFWDGKPTVDSR